MYQPRILFVLTSWSKLGDSGNPTGWYLTEFAHPYYVFEGRAEMTIASPLGGEAPLDPTSVEATKEDEEAVAFLNQRQELWQNTEMLSNFIGKAKEFTAVFVVGGMGPMFDLATDVVSQQIVKEFYEAGRLVVAVCHGPAALLNTKLSDGSYLVKNQAITAISNAEDDMLHVTQYLPFQLETSLMAKGATFEKAAEPFAPKIVTSGKDGRLLTGQNPASAGPLAKAVLDALATVI